MVTIDPADPAEADAVADLWVALAEDQRRHGSALRADANRAAMRESLARHAAADGLTVAHEAGTVVGFVRFDVADGALASDRTRGVVRDLFVVSDRRGEGIGRRLLGAAESALRNRGAEVVTVEALARNADAIRFYERRGYRPHRIEFEREVENDKRPRRDR
jgi:ribosomal protein S18 acetylase RimI-like enzyme